MVINDDIIKLFYISENKKHNIKEKFIADFEKSLNAENVPEISTVKMLPTYISKFPTNNSEGSFISIDLGGTNVRVVKIEIINNCVITESKSSNIPDYLKDGEGEDLFDFIANVLENGIRDFGMYNQKIKHIGFTFSFPCYQEALNHGILIQWGKLYQAKNVLGKNVVELLLRSCKKRGLHIDNVCLLNDTTGTFLCGSFEDKNTLIAMINGTGTNACYLEKTSNIRKIKKENYMLDNVIVNTEWGLIADTGGLGDVFTKYDKVLDEKSKNPGEQIFEKCVSGLHLPELVRILLFKESEILGISRDLKNIFSKDNSIDGNFLSSVNNYLDLKQLIKNKFEYEISFFEYEVCHSVCEIFVSRASILIALVLEILLEKYDQKYITIAVDGSMFINHHDFLTKISKELTRKTEKDIKFMIVKDGSGKGSALAACIASTEYYLFMNDLN